MSTWRRLLQGFFSKRSGCVFKWVKKGSPAAAPWHILLKEGDAAWQVVVANYRRYTVLPVYLVFFIRSKHTVCQAVLLTMPVLPAAALFSLLGPMQRRQNPHEISLPCANMMMLT